MPLLLGMARGLIEVIPTISQPVFMHHLFVIYGVFFALDELPADCLEKEHEVMRQLIAVLLAFAPPAPASIKDFGFVLKHSKKILGFMKTIETRCKGLVDLKLKAYVAKVESMLESDNPLASKMKALEAML